MPKRTIQHEIASQAVASISKIIAKVGAASEEVRNDYGEDLYVQTSWNEEVDAFRIWIQVKGKRNVRIGSDNVTVSVSRDHVLRWLASNDVVVVVLWDTSKDAGWWAQPSAIFNSYDVLLGESNSISLRFPLSMRFDERAMRRLVWEARLGHLNMRLSVLHSQIQMAQEFDNKEAEDGIWRQMIHATFDGLRFLGIMREEGYSKDFDAKLRRAYSNISTGKYALDHSSREHFDQAVMLLTLVEADQIARVGLPSPLLNSMSQMIGDWYISSYGSVETWLRSGFPPEGKSN